MIQTPDCRLIYMQNNHPKNRNPKQISDSFIWFAIRKQTLSIFVNIYDITSYHVKIFFKYILVTLLCRIPRRI